MCFTANDSLLAYVIGTITSIVLIQSPNSNFVVLGYFFLFVTQMQIFDFIFWKNQSCSWINTLATKLAIVFNHLQPILLLALQSIYGLSLSTPSLIIGILYAVTTSVYSFNALREVDCTLPVHGFMNWKWNALPGNTLVYGLFLASFVASSFNFSVPWIRWVTALTSVFSFIVAQKTPILNAVPGRIWCYYAALIPAFYAFMS
jgi:hypothetical protein